MRERARTPTGLPIGTYHDIPHFALRGVFRRHGYRDQDIAAAIGIGTSTLSLKMGGHSEWSSDEIAAICELLDIQQDEIGELFFPQMKKGA